MQPRLQVDVVLKVFFNLAVSFTEEIREAALCEKGNDYAFRIKKSGKRKQSACKTRVCRHVQGTATGNFQYGRARRTCTG